MDSTYLKYGDVILLASDAGPGYLQSQGFTNAKCFIQYQQKELRQSCRNFRDFIFKVEPKMVYDAKTQYLEFVKIKEKSQSNSKSELQLSDENSEIEEKLKAFEKKMIEEEESNKKLSARKQGEWVTYGNEIQLMHYDSKGFISALKVVADFDRSCNKVEIADQPSSAVYFKILPRYKFRQEGEKILYRDQVTLLNMRTNLYMHITERWIEINNKIALPNEDWRPLDADRRDDPSEYCKRYEVNCSTSISTFKPISHAQVGEDPSNKFIKGGQVVRLQHTELGGYLTSDDLDFTDDQLAEVYVRCFNGDRYDMEATTSGDLFEVEIAFNSNRGQICSFNEFEEIQGEFYYRLRHLNSGRLVRFQEVTISGKKIRTLGLSDHMIDKNEKELMESSLLKLFSTTVDNDNRIRSGETTKLYSIKTKEFLCTKEDQEWVGGVQGGGGRAQSRAQSRGFQRPTTKGRMDDFDDAEERKEEQKGFQGKRNKGKANEIYRPLDDDEFYNSRNLVVELNPKAANEDAFLISNVSESEVKDLLFVQTVGTQLYTFTKYLRAKKINDIPPEMYTKVIEILSKLIFFVTKTESTDPVRCEGIPIRSRQKLMRELRIIELLVDCLYYPFSSGVFKIKELTNDMPIKMICVLCYRLILHSVKNYKSNELYASQWIDLYFDHSMTAAETNLRAEATIAVLISNNKTLLEKQITRKTIEKFINLSKEQEKDDRFISLLAALCSCQDEAIPNNQNNVIELMYEKEKNREALHVPIRENADQVELCFDEDSDKVWISIKDLKEYSSAKQGKSNLYKYYLALIDLASETCLDRNRKALSNLGDIYKLNILFKVITNRRLEFTIRSRFVLLMYNMYIDKDPFIEIKVPNLTRIWDEISAVGNKILFYKEELPQYINDLKMYILYYLKDIKGVLSIFENDKNRMSLQVIKLVRCMVSFGFYKTKNELREISIALIQMLNGTTDIYELLQEKLIRENRMESLIRNLNSNNSTQNNQRYEKNEDNLIIMKCKQYICETLLKILDLEYDLRISLFLGFLKEEVESYYPISSAAVDPDYTSPVVTSKVFPQDSMKKRNDYANEEESNNRLLNIPQLGEDVSFEDNTAILWIEKVLMGEQLFDGYPQRTYVCVLMDLIAYQHLPLANKAFELLTKVFTQRANLIGLLRQIQLLEHPESIRTLNKCNEILHNLRNFIETIDFYLSEEALKVNSNDIAVGLVSSRESVDYFCQILIERRYLKRSSTVRSSIDSKNNFEIVHGFKSNTGDPVVIDADGNILRKSEFTNETIVANNENQRLLRNLGAHEIIIEILRYNINQNKNHSDYEDIIKSAYIFLIRFCKDNAVNQEIIGNHLDIFVKEINSSPLSIYLIKEIFKDNKLHLSSKGQKIIRVILKKEESIALTMSEKYHYLNTLKTFAKYKTKIVKKNQNEILINISGEEEGQICSYFNTSGGIAKIKSLVEKISKAKHDMKDDIAEIEFPVELYNLITFMDLVCVCCEGKNEFAELKAQTSVCRISDILQLLQYSDQFIPLKTSLVKYLYHAWLIVGKNEIFSEENYEEILWNIIEMLVRDLEAKDNDNQNEDSKVIYGPPYSKSLKHTSDIYIYTAVINSLGSVLKLSLNFDDKEDIISRIITTTCNLYYKAEINEFKRPAFDLINYTYQSQTFSKYLENLRHPILSGEEPISDDDQDFELTKTFGRSKSQSRKSNIFGGSNDRSKATIFAQKINSISKYEEMEELLEKEFEGMVKWYAEFSDLCDPEFQGFDPITHLFNLLDPENTLLSVELQIAGLKIIRKIVETCNDEMTTPAADWDNEDWEHYMAKIDIRQDYLVTKGCIHFLCNYISKCENSEAFDEAILACIALCLGGNFESQEEFLNYMMADSSNQFLLKIRDMIARKFEVVKVLVAEKSAQLLHQYNLEEVGESNNQRTHQTTMTGVGDFIDITEDTDDVGDIEEENEIGSETETVESAVININRIFRFLQLLCENHFLGNQDYLREQKVDDVINPKSFDFVAYISNLFGIFIKSYVNCYSSDIGDLLMSLLTELIQGPCKGNQLTEINNKVIENCTELIFSYNSSKLLKQKGFVGDKAIELDELKQHCVTLLLSLIEGKCDDYLKNSMIQAIDNFYIVFQRMHDIYEKFVDEELGLNPKSASLSQVTSRLKNDSFDCFIQEGFELYILIKLLMDDKDPEAMRRYKEYEQQLPAEDEPDSMHRSVLFYKKFLGSCEVIVKGDLFRVYFPIPPVCRFLSAQTKEEFLANVSRDSPQLKIAGFIEAMPDLRDSMEHAERLNRGFIKITQDTVFKIRNVAYLIVLAINILILSLYQIDSSNTGSNPYYIKANATMTRYELAVNGLGIAEIAVLSLLILIWLYTNFSLEVKRYWRDYNSANMSYYYPDKPVTNVYESSGSGEMGSGRVFTKPASSLTLREARRTLKFFGIEAPEFNMGGKRDYGHFIVRLEYYWLSFIFIFKNGTFLYFMTLLLFACAGFKLSIMFYSFILLDIVGRLPVLQDVIKSVTLNYKELLLTALLGVIIIFIYSNLYFAYFQDHYYDANVNIAIKARNGNITCYNLYHCFLSTLGYGLRGGGGIADSILPVSYSNVNTFFLRYVFDMSFFVIIVTVLLNIIFGIIIDTFAELREGKADLEYDKNNICFVCGVERFQFDRYGEGFEKHIESDHSIFNYLYYKIYISNKPTTEFNGTESNIGEDSSWFPFNKALILEKNNDNKGEEEKDSIHTYIQELENQIITLETKANEL